MRCKPSQHPSCELVSKTKGWLWNANDEWRKGWRPGAVKKPVARIMKFFAAQRRLEEQQHENEFVAVEEEAPTLQILSRNGEYCIVLSSQHNDVNPIVFMLSKSDFAKRIAQLKQILLERGLKVSCNCKRGSFADCECIQPEVKEKIEFELREMSKDEDDLRLTDELLFELLKASDDSEMDFTFTPSKFEHKVKSISYAACQCEHEVVPSPPPPTPSFAAESQSKYEKSVNVAWAGTTKQQQQQRDGIPVKKGSKDDSKM